MDYYRKVYKVMGTNYSKNEDRKKPQSLHEFPWAVDRRYHAGEVYVVKETYGAVNRGEYSFYV